MTEPMLPSTLRLACRERRRDLLSQSLIILGILSMLAGIIVMMTGCSHHRKQRAPSFDPRKPDNPPPAVLPPPADTTGLNDPLPPSPPASMSLMPRGQSAPLPPPMADSLRTPLLRGQDDAPLPQPPLPPALPETSTLAQTPLPPPPAPPAAPPRDDNLAQLRQLHQRASAQYARMGDYVVKLYRQEQIHGEDKPMEEIMFKFRNQPWSVYFKWIGEVHQGREVIYVKGQYDDHIHTRLGNDDRFPLMFKKVISLPVDSPFVKGRSRHSITEAGIGHMIASLGPLLDAVERRDPRAGTLRYLGSVNRPEFATPLVAFEHHMPPMFEPQLPRGGRRQFFIDPANYLPMLVLTYDETGHQVEYYRYENFQYPVRLTDADFDPRQWEKR
ncbi:MAG: DUF1571 domain-containing protein [Gemmataceae bacterium]